jgi:mannose-6-phosphate isomerase
LLKRAEDLQPPWGSWTVLDEKSKFKVKRIEVRPGHRLSYQKHSRRNEHWYVVEGMARVTIDGKDCELVQGDAVDIAPGAAHRIGNIGSGPLVFIEIQRGDYFGEDDIVRLSDDYGRAEGIE